MLGDNTLYTIAGDLTHAALGYSSMPFSLCQKVKACFNNGELLGEQVSRLDSLIS
jgi:hypothetical protein